MSLALSTTIAAPARVNEYLRRAVGARFELSARRTLVDRYAWAIPNAEALRTLGEYAPLIEVGAGTGYWASLLRERGVNIRAYDKAPPLRGGADNGHFSARRELWTHVEQQDERIAGAFPHHTLFLCWPPYNRDMASRALAMYQRAGGKHIAYVGEGERGCTGDEQFHHILDKHWVRVKRVAIPTWDGIHDGLTVYERKGQA